MDDQVLDSDRSLPLLERERELSAIDELISDAGRCHARLLLIEGPAGIGKTRLLEAARERAREAGARVITARGGELERDFGFGVVRQLLEPALASAGREERERLLSGAAGLAEPALATDPVTATGPADPSHAVLHGLYWLTVGLAERSPLLLLVDDLQWVDQPSLRFLHHLVRRVDGLPLAVAVATRTGAGDELLRALALEAPPPILRPRPLTETAAGEVVSSRLGVAPHATVTAACHEATGGNPFLLTELLEELSHQGGSTPELTAGSIRRLTSDRIAAATLLRIASVDPDAPALARAVAVLGDKVKLELAARLAGVTPARARRVAGLLADANVLRLGEPPAFAHPLVRASVHEDLPVEERGELHRRSAELLAEDGAAPEAIAVHLLQTEPCSSARTVDILRAAARAALARGSPETAASFLRRALDEPPDGGRRGPVLLELGAAEALLADAARAARHLEDARAQLTGTERSAATRLLAGVLGMSERPVDAVRLLVEEAACADPRAAARLSADAMNVARMSPAAWPIARGTAASLRDRVVRAGDEDPHSMAAVAGDMVQAGEPAARTGDLAERALDALPPPHRWALSDWSGPVCVRTLISAERFDRARRFLDAVIAGLQTRGDVLLGALALAYRSDLRHRVGDVAGAEDDALMGERLCTEYEWSVGLPALVSWRILALVERGDLAAAEALLQDRRLGGPAESLPAAYTFHLLLDVRGRLRLATGRAAESAEDLLECGRRQLAIGERNPALVGWRGAAALALVQVGEREHAERLAGEEVGEARAFGAPGSLGRSLRVAGIVAGGETGIDLLREAVGVLGSSEARLEHARALVDLGAALRRSGHAGEARGRLAEGMDLAHRCGAVALVDRARQELVLSGSRPRRPATSGRDALTPGERRVAEMAAQGRSNKDIAQALFVTLRTVEMHLTNAYRKLGISSRGDLAAALADDRPARMRTPVS